DDSWLAKGLSLGERLLYRLLFGRFPRFQGIFMIRRRLLGELPLLSDGRGWGIVMELILRAARGPYALVRVPTEWRGGAPRGPRGGREGERPADHRREPAAAHRAAPASRHARAKPPLRT